MTSLSRLSESVYMGLCLVVGTSEQVAMRREIDEIKEMIGNHDSNITVMRSGSYKEGFRLIGSDMDTMVWSKNYKVISNVSQMRYYDRSRYTLILMENSISKPGFVLLQLMLPCISCRRVFSSCIRINNKCYISSSQFRKQFLLSNATIHGPCSNFFMEDEEYDLAFCFSCDFWPPLAYPWINRCKSWPPFSVLQDIVRSGVHFMAIGNRGSPQEDIEWRTSFSLAEQKLVYSMNHCQFLVYGLLKLFLKEVIHHNVQEHEKLLCSYFLKTALFWQIQENRIPIWYPQNLLICFWSCFKCIIQWVYQGVCPNFFIPQNNMFCGKVQGQSQKRLFLHLYGLYGKGLSCLLQCSSIMSYLMQVLYHPTCIITTCEKSILSELEIDLDLWRELNVCNSTTTTVLSECTKILHKIVHLFKSANTKQQFVFLQTQLSLMIQTVAFLLHNNSKTGCNKRKYILDKLSCRMLQISANIGCISGMLYLAMYYYNTFREAEAISILQMTKIKISKPYVICMGRARKQSYTEALRGQSWFTKLRKAFALTVKFPQGISYIKEFELEQSLLSKGIPVMSVPPVIMLHMLLVLCFKHDAVKRQEALNELFVILHNDEGMYVPSTHRDISWQILGICQEMCNDWQGALQSYNESLKHKPCNGIQIATHIRIQHVVKQLTSSKHYMQN